MEGMDGDFCILPRVKNSRIKRSSGPIHTCGKAPPPHWEWDQAWGKCEIEQIHLRGLVDGHGRRFLHFTKSQKLQDKTVFRSNTHLGESSSASLGMGPGVWEVRD